MGVRVQIPRKATLLRILMHPVGKFILVSSVAVFTLAFLVFTFYYFRFSRMIDEKLAGGPFSTPPPADDVATSEQTS